MLRRLLPLLTVCAAVLSACIKPPPQLVQGPFEDVTVVDAQQRDLIGQRVRWGGSIASVSTGKEDTCFEIVEHPLSAEARPMRTDRTGGRFLACAAGFFDPVVYTTGRELTVIGTLQTPQVGKIGERDYTYPRLAAESIYLWPRRRPYPRVYYDPWLDPFWYPYWGPWPSPYWRYYR